MSKWATNNGKYEDSTKEERANACNNILCPYCKYQNHDVYIKKFGTCHLCGRTLDKDYFKKRLIRKMREV